jgi:hypothetical protein
MTAAQMAWDELATAGLDMVESCLQAGETMVASLARMTTLGDAARWPLCADSAEVGAMVMEKAVAVSRENQALVDQWSLTMRDASEQAAHLGSLLASRRLRSRVIWQGSRNAS